jgi:catechol 2,3-dioxygenase-like lactoylglutathione lyase family enzyme
MPRSLFHVVALTDDLDGVVRFLSDVAGLQPVRPFADEPATQAQAEQLFGWPAGEVSVRGAAVGEGAGMVEVIEIPEPLRGTEQPRVVFLTLATQDLDRYEAKAREAGFAVGPRFSGDGALADFATVPVTVGGLPFEFISFGPAADH